MKAEGAAEAAIVQAEAQGVALKQINAKLGSAGGKLAAEFLLGQRYVDAFEQQARKENVILSSQRVNDVQG